MLITDIAESKRAKHPALKIIATYGWVAKVETNTDGLMTQAVKKTDIARLEQVKVACAVTAQACL